MKRGIKKRHQGNNYRRLAQEDNYQERIFLEEWQRLNEKEGLGGATLLSVLLGADQKRPAPATDRDYFVAATVIQWLGTEVGSSFRDEALMRIVGELVRRWPGKKSKLRAVK